MAPEFAHPDAFAAIADGVFPVLVSPGPSRSDAEPLVGLETVEVWGLPLARLSFVATLERIERLIAAGRGGFFITANLHYAMLTAGDARLAALNGRALFLLADGMPLVWQSNRLGRPLPERVTGSDLTVLLCQQAARLGHRVFLLGGAEGVARQAAAVLVDRYPGLQIVGAEAPPFRPLSAAEHEALLARIRRARPDLLFVAFGQPKGETWLDENIPSLGPVVGVQIGATLDFIAGRVRRAPKLWQRLGLEWLYRALSEPRRLIPRYWADGLFLLRSLIREYRRQ